MPELPDITVYIDALRPRVVGQVLQRIRIVSPFLRTCYGVISRALRDLASTDPARV